MAGDDLDRAPEPFLFRHSARQILFGPGRLRELAAVAEARRVERAVVVMDGFFIGGALEARVRDVLGDLSRVEVHGVPIREPDTGTVEACRRVLEAARPDMVVAVGGGSTMDTAKVARILLSNPGAVEEMAGFDRHYEPHRSIMACVPTTAGTASEVSEMAVIGLEGVRRQAPLPVAEHYGPVRRAGPGAAADHAAGGHGQHRLRRPGPTAIESYVSRGANIMSDPYALDAVRRLVRWLPVAYRRGDDPSPAATATSARCSPASPSTRPSSGWPTPSPRRSATSHHVVHGKANALACRR